MIYLAKIFQWSKSLHRLSLLAMVGLSLVMGLTGTWLRFPMTASGVIDLDLALLRFLHYQFSPWFSIIIGIMTTSGLYMYWYPWYAKRIAQKKAAASGNASGGAGNQSLDMPA